MPRYGFISWLAIRDRLATGHRTRQWGQMQCCVYCGEPDETRDHLFFACPYTFTLWLNVVGNLFGPDRDPDWEITLQRMLGGTYERLTYILLRLVWQTTIYFIWREWMIDDIMGLWSLGISLLDLSRNQWRTESPPRGTTWSQDCRD